MLSGAFSICRLSGRVDLPREAVPFGAVIFDGRAYTWVGPQELTPEASNVQSGYRALEVEGPLEFNLTGVLAGLSGVLSEAGVPIFAISTYNTDYILLHTRHLQKAVRALRDKGYNVVT